MFTDTHAHLAFDEFAADLPAVIARAHAAAVTRIVSIAADPGSVARTFEICRQHPGVSLTVGLHPELVPGVAVDHVTAVRQQAAAPQVVAIGEIGLDYHRLPAAASGDAAYNTSGVGRVPPRGELPAAASGDAAYNTSGVGRVPPRGERVDTIKQRQQALLVAQLALAKELRKPVVIHNRDANVDLLEMLRAHAAGLPPNWRPWGVMHCFGGGERFGFDCLEIGLLLSYTGILTFKNAAALRETAAKIPLDRVMLETDAPYLAPHPHRGQRNEPAQLPLIAQTLADIKGVSVAEVAAVTTANAQRLFGLTAG